MVESANRIRLHFHTRKTCSVEENSRRSLKHKNSYRNFHEEISNSNIYWRMKAHLAASVIVAFVLVATTRAGSQADRASNGTQDGTKPLVAAFSPREIPVLQPSCVTWGRDHYSTFDNKVYTFHGECSYVLAFQPTVFDIMVVNDKDCDQQSQCKRGLNIFFGDASIHLRGMVDGPRVIWNGKDFKIPGSRTGTTFEKIGNYLVVRSALGFTIKWDGKNYILIQVSDQLKNKVAGLCGQYNGNSHDDFESADGKILTSAVNFAASWKKTDLSNDGTACEEPTYEPLCKTDEEAQDIADRKCRDILDDPAFEQCHSLVDPGPYFDSCQYDCCDSEKTECTCGTLEAYSRACGNQGVEINWRKAGRCEITCMEGKVYKECQSPCLPDCNNVNAVCSDSTCIDGCFCPDGQVLHHGKCIDNFKCPCEHNQIEYEDSQTITEDCNTCTCEEGKWVCTQDICGAICSAIGLAHFVTFDGARYDFQSECSYYLMKDPDFQIILDMKCGHVDGTCTRSVTVNYRDQQITLDHNHQLLANNGQEIAYLPYKDLGFYVSKVSSILMEMKLDNGIVIKWDGKNRIDIKAPPFLRGQTKGLCGTYDGKQNNDFITPSGNMWETNAFLFANYWKTKTACADIKNIAQSNPCASQVQRKEEAKKHCKVLAGKVFEDCHNTEDIEEYYKDCLFDMCSCAGNLKDCFCSSLSYYADVCAAKGVKIPWRNKIKECKVQCPPGQVYQVCGRPCERTCRNMAENTDLLCNQKCVEGCNCPDGQSLNDNEECIPVKKCSCIFDGREYPAGFTTLMGLELCKCTDAKWKCERVNFNVPIKKMQQLCPHLMEYSTCAPSCPATCIHSEDEQKCEKTKNCMPGCVCQTGYLLDGDKCIDKNHCPCHHGGKSYYEGESFFMDCNNCSCKNHRWQCENNSCPATCSAYGDSHYSTFDGRKYEFQGNCDYVLVQSTDPKMEFTITVKNVHCGTSGVACSKGIDFIMGKKGTTSFYSLKIIRGKRVIPEPQSPFKIEEIGEMLYISVPFGITLQWDRGTRLYIKANSRFMNKVKGLCGNFNGNRKDDFTVPQGGPPVAKATEFGDSWKVHSYCEKSENINDTCDMAPQRRSWAQLKCSILASELFEPCHLAVPYEDFRERCEFDACACDQGGDCECLCTAIAAYAHECATRGIIIKWRTKHMCSMECSECKGYNPCMSHCPKKTCDNRLFYGGLIKDCQAEKNLCFEGCDLHPCPEGQVYDSLVEPVKCIPEPLCDSPSCDISGKKYKEGERIDDPTVCRLECEICNCRNGKLDHITFGKCTAKTPPSPVTPTIPYVTPSAKPFPAQCVTSGWTSWMSGSVPTHDNTGDRETTDDLRRKYSLCEDNQITDIRCRVISQHEYGVYFGQNVTCSLSTGFTCQHKDQIGKFCLDYEVSFYCNCEIIIIQTTLYPQYSTTNGTTPESSRTASTVSTHSSSSFSPPHSTSPQVLVSTPKTSIPSCGWTEWMNSFTPDVRGEMETMSNLRMAYSFCEHPLKIVCRTVPSHGYPDGISFDQSGQHAVSCDLNRGLVCVNSMQQNGHHCYDYEVSIFCIDACTSVTEIRSTTNPVIGTVTTSFSPSTRNDVSTTSPSVSESTPFGISTTPGLSQVVPCSESFWLQFVSRSVPEANGGDREYLTKAEMQELCVDGKITKIACYTIEGKPYKESGDVVDCSLEKGLTCSNKENEELCQDYKIRYWCQCNSESTASPSSTSSSISEVTEERTTIPSRTYSTQRNTTPYEGTVTKPPSSSSPSIEEITEVTPGTPSRPPTKIPPFGKSTSTPISPTSSSISDVTEESTLTSSARSSKTSLPQHSTTPNEGTVTKPPSSSSPLIDEITEVTPGTPSRPPTKIPPFGKSTSTPISPTSSSISEVTEESTLTSSATSSKTSLPQHSTTPNEGTVTKPPSSSSPLIDEITEVTPGTPSRPPTKIPPFGKSTSTPISPTSSSISEVTEESTLTSSATSSKTSLPQHSTTPNEGTVTKPPSSSSPLIDEITEVTPGTPSRPPTKNPPFGKSTSTPISPTSSSISDVTEASTLTSSATSSKTSLPQHSTTPNEGTVTKPPSSSSPLIDEITEVTPGTPSRPPTKIPPFGKSTSTPISPTSSSISEVTEESTLTSSATSSKTSLPQHSTTPNEGTVTKPPSSSSPLIDEITEVTPGTPSRPPTKIPPFGKSTSTPISPTSSSISEVTEESTLTSSATSSKTSLPQHSTTPNEGTVTKPPSSSSPLIDEITEVTPGTPSRPPTKIPPFGKSTTPPSSPTSVEVTEESTTTPSGTSSTQYNTTPYEAGSRTPPSPQRIKVRCNWSPWLNSDKPKTNPEDVGDLETISSLKIVFGICPRITKIECRIAGTSTHAGIVQQKGVQCDPVNGLMCYNRDTQDGICYDYEVRVFCWNDGCEEKTTTLPATSTMNPILTSPSTIELPNIRTTVVCPPGQAWMPCAYQCQEVCVSMMRGACTEKYADDCVPGCITLTEKDTKKCSQDERLNSDDVCVPKELCSCLKPDGTEAKAAETWPNPKEPCSKCSCFNNEVVCGTNSVDCTLPSISTTMSPTPTPPYKCGWSDWINTDTPDTGPGDMEILSVLHKTIGICTNPLSIQCREAGTHKESRSLGQKVECNHYTGLSCFNRFNHGKCADFEIRVLCPCISTEAPPITTNPTIASLTTEPTSKKPPICGWTIWMSDHIPDYNDEDGEHEHFKELRKRHEFCDTNAIIGIECRDKRTKKMASELGQQVQCDINFGLVCFNHNQPTNRCADYEVRFYCDPIGSGCSSSSLSTSTFTTAQPKTSNTTVTIRPLDRICDRMMGLKSGEIRDDMISASSQRDYNHSPRSVRLENKYSWMPSVSDKNQYIQIDLGTTDAIITGIIIQGSPTTGASVTSYKIVFSSDGKNWVPILETLGKEQVFNVDWTERVGVKEYFQHPFRTRLFRVIPITWSGHISMRMELIGCPTVYPSVSPKVSTPYMTTSTAIDTTFKVTNTPPYRKECVDWNDWVDVHHPTLTDRNDIESIDKVRAATPNCSVPMAIECRTATPDHLPYYDSGQPAKCNLWQGFECHSKDVPLGKMCLNYEVRLGCLKQIPECLKEQQQLCFPGLDPRHCPQEGCASGLFCNGSQCVYRSQCPCMLEDKFIRPDGLTKSKDCEICQCLNGEVMCLPKKCQPKTCDLGEAVLNSDTCECECHECDSNEFQCSSGICIPLENHCDNFIDCEDDEINCETSKVTTPPFPSVKNVTSTSSPDTCVYVKCPDLRMPKLERGLTVQLTKTRDGCCDKYLVCNPSDCKEETEKCTAPYKTAKIPGDDCCPQHRCVCPTQCPKSVEPNCPIGSEVIEISQDCNCTMLACLPLPKTVDSLVDCLYTRKYEFKDGLSVKISDPYTVSYKHGDSWTDGPCKTCRCTNGTDSSTEISCEEQMCTPCTFGYIKVQSPGSCCGNCEPNGCKVGNTTYQVGEKLPSTKQCYRKSCERDNYNGGFIIQETQVKCESLDKLPFCEHDVESADSGEIQDETGCCMKCVPKDAFNSTNVCTKCSLQLVFGQPKYSIGYFTVMLPSGVTCKNENPLPDLKKCMGYCLSGSVFTHMMQKQSQCQSCQVAKSRKVAVMLSCSNGSNIVRQYEMPESCSCGDCNSYVAK